MTPQQSKKAKVADCVVLLSSVVEMAIILPGFLMFQETFLLECLLVCLFIYATHCLNIMKNYVFQRLKDIHKKALLRQSS